MRCLRTHCSAQRRQPQIAAINAKYKNLSLRDPKKAEQNQEVMELYKKHGVNPPAHVPSGTSTNHTGTPPAGGFGGGGASSSARQAAFKACGATGHLGGSSTTATTGG